MKRDRVIIIFQNIVRRTKEYSLYPALSSPFPRAKTAFHKRRSIDAEDVFCPFYRMLMRRFAHSDADAVAINIISIAGTRVIQYFFFFLARAARRGNANSVSRVHASFIW